MEYLTDALSFLPNSEQEKELFRKADKVRREHYGTDVYIRGLIEVTNYCNNNCYYCGIRKGNRDVKRYRLSKDEILTCCEQGYKLGFRTFVLQGGEDAAFTDDLICSIVSEIKSLHSDCAVTLSLGEKSYGSYKAYFDAGADRYLLRHETANSEHYKKLHPDNMSFERRINCLWNLKQIGYQVGTGIMVGSPFQTFENIVEDLQFMQELQPDMIGVGVYLSHHKTPFSEYPNGDLHLCIRLIAVLRLMFPYALLPATTALGTIDPKGRELALSAGANVIMPNLSPASVRKQYELYDNKAHTGAEAAESLMLLREKVESAGYSVVIGVGNPLTTR